LGDVIFAFLVLVWLSFVSMAFLLSVWLVVWDLWDIYDIYDTATATTRKRQRRDNCNGFWRFAIYAFCKTPHPTLSRKGRGKNNKDKDNKKSKIAKRVLAPCGAAVRRIRSASLQRARDVSAQGNSKIVDFDYLDVAKRQVWGLAKSIIQKQLNDYYNE
jgi:hypothetical protein